MEHLSEILKILDGALKANASMASNYAGLLAEKLEQAGDGKQARMIRERLARAPVALANAQDASSGVSFGNLPVDGESHLHTVDVSHPMEDETPLLLPSAIASRISEFIANVQRYDELARVNAAMPSRLLAYGLPGTGKTKLARYIAAKLRLPLLTVRCDTLVSSLLGQTSRNLRRVFEFAQQRPCVLLLDEFDALASARGNDRDVGELQRVVIALLQNIDAIPESTVVIAATNHDRLLDPAVWRRFGFRVPMPIPDTALRRQLWIQFLLPYTTEGIDVDHLASISTGITGANIEQVCLDTKRATVLAGAKEISELELVRRLGLNLAITNGILLSTVEAEIYWLREWSPKHFSLRALAKLYGLSTRYIGKVIKEGTDHDPQERPRISPGPA
ncbi:TPA: ATP-binding protein [Pseudomonas aeruginosa]|uniref:anti-phage ATPase IteA n=1 Tax=Pseudomonas aeruginosa TaxID=287 RepID=UPI002993FE9D|nr:AAA family ATPase [Pseudomonas aeruginosa]HCR1382495.1 ATP-binding protein [Pseudomonas aeruginosa]HCR1588457.1 ATP-binding protein [Pseudomonas aeruginosa]